MLSDLAVVCRWRDRSSAKPRGWVRMDRWPGDFRRCWAVVELSHRSVGPTAPSRGPLQLELVQALAVVGQRHQVPLTGHLVEAAQRESGEAEGRLDDAEDRLDGLLAQPVQRTAFLAVELGGGFCPCGRRARTCRIDCRMASVGATSLSPAIESARPCPREGTRSGLLAPGWSFWEGQAWRCSCRNFASVHASTRNHFSHERHP